MSCSVGHRLSSDPELLWLWCRPAAAVPIPPLAWELPCAVGTALKRPKKKKKKKLWLERYISGENRFDLPTGQELSSSQLEIGFWNSGEMSGLELPESFNV